MHTNGGWWRVHGLRVRDYGTIRRTLANEICRFYTVLFALSQFVIHKQVGGCSILGSRNRSTYNSIYGTQQSIQVDSISVFLTFAHVVNTNDSTPNDYTLHDHHQQPINRTDSG